MARMGEWCAVMLEDVDCGRCAVGCQGMSLVTVGGEWNSLFHEAVQCSHGSANVCQPCNHHPATIL